MNDLSAQKRQQKLKAINEAVDELPLLPATVAQLMALSTSDERYFEKVSELAESDPTFTLRLIKLANSAANSPVTPITSISRAISRIGARQIKGLTKSFAIAKIFIPSNHHERNLWVHSIQVAVTSQAIARMAAAYPGVNQEDAYLCGLLHDIGRFVLFNRFPEGIPRIDEKDWGSPDELIQAERETIGIDHAKLGGYAAKRWGLQSEVANVITNHHLYDYASVTKEEKKEAMMVRIVQMADYLSIMVMMDPDIPSLPPKELQQLIEKKCVHKSWPSAPVAPLLLQQEVPAIFEKASEIIEGLNINIDE